MKIRIITSCTKEKHVNHPKQPLLEDFMRGPDHMARIEDELLDFLRPAEKLYRGKQHELLMRGVAHARAAGHEVDVFVVSAGYGLVPGHRKLAPYNATFDDFTEVKPFRQWARQLGVARDLHALLEKPADKTFLLLGNRYFEAAALHDVKAVGSPTYALVATEAARLLPSCIEPVVLPQSMTKHYRVGNIGLKGEVMARILEGRDPLARLMEPSPAPASVLQPAVLTGTQSAPASQLDLFGLARAEEAREEIARLTGLQAAPRRRLG